jgi:photosystem II stability/assembly factor-like uncharacterized protein
MKYPAALSAILGAVALIAVAAVAVALAEPMPSRRPVAAPTTTTSPTATTSPRSRATAIKPPGLNPIPLGATLRTITVSFLNLTLGYGLISAKTGRACEVAVEKTTDGGAAFGSPVPVAPCAQFTLTHGTTAVSLTFDDHGDGFVYGSSFYVTHDGGSTWQAVSEPGQVVDVRAVGSSIWMFVGQCKTPSCWVVLMESTDGGVTWHQSPVQPPIYTQTTDPQLVRLSTLSAYVLTAPRTNAFGEPATTPMWFTADAGQSWVQRDLSCPINAGGIMAAAPDGKLFAVCAGEPGLGQQLKSVVESTNGGITWSAAGPCTTKILGLCATKTLFGGYLGSVVATSSTIVYLAGHRSPIYKTANGGTTWTSVGGTPATGEEDLTFFNDDDGLALAERTSTLWRTDDGGATWSTVALKPAP